MPRNWRWPKRDRIGLRLEFRERVVAFDIVEHEFGHSFSGLADEYDSAFPGFLACSDSSGPACEANVTDDLSAAKWSPWIDAATPAWLPCQQATASCSHPCEVVSPFSLTSPLAIVAIRAGLT